MPNAEIVYEVWVAGVRGSFRKLPPGEVEQHILDQLEDLEVGQTIHVAKHLLSEYSPSATDPRD